jgi:hypothetical protein
MLRAVVLVIALMIAAIGAWLWSRGLTGPGIQALCVGGLFALGIVFERWRYKRNEPPPPDARWQATGERFTDPATGKDVEVLYDPSSGERRYVER